PLRLHPRGERRWAGRGPGGPRRAAGAGGAARVSAMRSLYSALVYALLPAALVRLWWRGRREPGYRQHVAERFGRYGEASAPAPLIWLHAVSVGETRGAEPLVRALSSAY